MSTTSTHNKNTEEMLELIIRHNLCVRKVILIVSRIVIAGLVGSILTFVCLYLGAHNGAYASSFYALAFITPLIVLVRIIAMCVELQGEIRKTSERESKTMKAIIESRPSSKEE